MARNLKVLGLALVAVFAFSAVASSVAAAETSDAYWFKSDATGTAVTNVTGTQVGTDSFTTDGGVVNCTSTDLVGSQSGPTATTLTLAPTYGGCTFAGFPATITPASCKYVFHTDGKTTPSNVYDVSTDIACTGTDKITVVVKVTGVTKCTITIPPQVLGTGITLASNGSDITASINLNNISFTEISGTGIGACATTTNTTNGRFIGTNTFTGKNSLGGQTSIFVE
jgi:hypothetical protein